MSQNPRHNVGLLHASGRIFRPLKNKIYFSKKQKQKVNGTRLRSTPLPTCKDSPRSRPFTFFAIFLFFISACCRFLFIGITKKLLQTTLHELPFKEVKKTLRKLKNIISDLKDSTLNFILGLCMFGG